MQNAPLSGTDWRDVALQLPFPVFVVDARSPKLPVVAANAAFEEIAGDASALVGRPVDDILDSRLFTPGADELLADLLTSVVASGTAVRGRRVEITPNSLPGGRVARVHCWLSLSPLIGDDGVWGVVGTLVDDLGEGVNGPRRARRETLRLLASDLASDRPLDQLLEAAAEEVAATAGAGRAAVMLSDGSNEFNVVATCGDPSLPPRFSVTNSSEELVDVAWGRARLVWSPDATPTADVAAGLPFAGSPGWERALVVGMRVRGGGFGLLAVADPVEGDWDDGALERLELAAVFISAAVETASLRGEYERLEEMLRGAVQTTAALAASTDPGEVRRTLVRGIVEDMRVPGAALWVADPAGSGDAVLAAAAGLPDDVRAALTRLPASDPVVEAVGGHRRWRVPTDALSASAWDQHQLLLVPVPEPTAGALGVYSVATLPAGADEVLATLTQALCASVQSTTQHRRTRSVVDALQRQLQPRLFELPAGMDAGFVYRSATAGVPIGGDFLDLFQTADGHVGIACGDVSGKGIEAATLAAMAVYSLRAFALQGATPRMVISMMDSAVEAQIGDDRFATMTYGRIDPVAWTIEMTVAGHPPALVVGPSGVSVPEVPSDVPVGMLGDSAYEQSVIELPPGHSLVLYTDGVIEARGGDEERALFGHERLVEALDGLRTCDAQGIADAVWARVQEWSDGDTTDDVAVVVVRRAGA